MSSQFTESVDCHGNPLRFGDLGDFLLPPFPTIPDFRQHACDVKEMELNPADVIITNFPKTGSHWITSIVHMLMEGSADSYFKHGLGNFLDKTPMTSDTIEPADKPRLFITHFKFHHLPRQVREKRVKLIYLERNPKDTWVSWFNHVVQPKGNMAYKGTWNQFFDAMMSTGLWYGNWFDFALDWEQDIDKGRAAGVPIFVNPFEDMKKDPVGQIEKLDRFLGCNRGRELYEQIAAACHFPIMKSAKLKEWAGIGHSLDASTMYRKGEVGDWKNWFTVAQNEEFDRVFKDRMQGSKLRYTYE